MYLAYHQTKSAVALYFLSLLLIRIFIPRKRKELGGIYQDKDVMACQKETECHAAPKLTEVGHPWPMS